MVMKRKTLVIILILTLIFDFNVNLNVFGSTKKVKKSYKRSKIVNIAFFGLDKLNEKASGRSDSMQVITIDYIHKKLKLTSFMRDLYVHVDGHGFTKLTHAYAYGGSKLAIKTLNENFGLDIKDYCTVDFFTFEKIIDSIGGIKIDVKENEIKYINSLAFVDPKNKNKIITKSGKQLLNGAQALAYSRIRSIGSGDFDRTERQRTVLMALVNKANASGNDSVIDLVIKLKPYVKTNMTREQLITIGTDYLNIKKVKVQEERFPIDGYWKNYMNKGVYYLKSDLGLMKKQVVDYIFKDQKQAKLR